MTIECKDKEISIQDKEERMETIDFVITWVDGNDPVWQKERAKYKGEDAGDSGPERYRDWNLLKYWFRGVETFAPWVNQIHFVTFGHLPPWLNTDHPKLHIVRHEDFIPSEYLPTFSSRTIDFNLHRIKGLAEQFVYFNDDMFLTAPVSPSLFFLKGKPCDCAIMEATTVYASLEDGERVPLESLYVAPAIDLAIINRNFDKRKVVKDHWKLWLSPKNGKGIIKLFLLWRWNRFTGFRSKHIPYSYLKSSFDEVWNKEGEVLEHACRQRFRNPIDVSNRLITYWQIVSGQIALRSPQVGRRYSLASSSGIEKAITAIKTRKYKMICLNDEYHGDSFTTVSDQIREAFQTILPVKSSFER